MADTNGWVYLGEFWEPLLDIAAARHGQKAAFASSNPWTKEHNTHFVGLCGEAVVAIRTGLKVDRKLRLNGDPGFDFDEDGVTYDAKAATFLADPDLKEFPDKEKWADVYILVAVDIPNRRGRVVAWATREQLEAAGLRDYGHGDMLSLAGRTLDAIGQGDLPPELEALGIANGRC